MQDLPHDPGSSPTFNAEKLQNQEALKHHIVFSAFLENSILFKSRRGASSSCLMPATTLR